MQYKYRGLWSPHIKVSAVVCNHDSMRVVCNLYTRHI